MDFLLAGAVLCQSRSLGRHGVEVARGEVLGIGPGELQEPRDDTLEPVDFVDQMIEALVAQAEPSSPELRDAADASQGVADFMGHPGEELPQRRQALTSPELGPESLALGRLAAD